MRYAFAFAVLVFLAARTLMPHPDAVRREQVFPLRPPPAALASAPPAPSPAPAPVPSAAALAPRPSFLTAPPEDREMFMEAAQAAWAYVERESQPATGLVNSVTQYPYSTVWDMASGLAALYSAHELGLVEEAEYDRRMRLSLRTLRTLRLYEGVAFNKNYSTRTGRIAGRNDREQASQRGYGWSVTDIGRLLVWLRIIADNQPQYAAEAEAIARRLDYSRLVADGYLWGEDLDRRGKPRRYMEGMIPYEQYAAAGFAMWGHRAEKALSLAENATPTEVMGIQLVDDRRGHGRLTSEPLVMAGLELGWEPQMRQLAVGALAAQEARWRRTGQVTVASEDAIPQRPYYFYYYTIYSNGRAFGIDVMNPRARLNGPRWVSAKGAYAWHALLPSDYTRRAVGAVARARHPVRGWSSGVYERSGRSTGAENINTAAVILEAALFPARGGRPLAVAGPSPRTDVVPVLAPTTAPPVQSAPAPAPANDSGSAPTRSEAGAERPAARRAPARSRAGDDASASRPAERTAEPPREEFVDTLPSRVLSELFPAEPPA